MLRPLLSMLLAFSCIVLINKPVSARTTADKIITIVVDESSNVIMGSDTLSTDKIAQVLQQRLWKSYMGTGKMYDAIKIEYHGEVSSERKTAVMNEIRKAQKTVLTEVCLEKHKKLFESLSGRQQDKLRRQFPVLFQE